MPSEPLFRKIDCLQIPVPDLDAGLRFYCGQLGHEIIWRTETSAGLRLPDTDAEIVIQTEREELEANLLVSSVEAAVEHIVGAGGQVVVPPFDIQIGRCAVVQDPWGNRTMTKHKTLFITQRGQRHQQAALDAAPADLEIVMRRTTDKKEISALLPEVEFFVSERAGVIDAEIVAAGKNLKLIQRLGSQVWDIDAEAAKRAGIPVCYWPVKTCVLVAEHMMLQMIGMARRIREMMKITSDAADWEQKPERGDEDHFAYNWSGRRDIGALWRSTVGILGFGEIGAELARRLKGFESRVFYNKRHPLPPPAEAELNLTYATRDELLRQSDFVCSLLPYSREVDQSLDAAFFAAMKPGAFFAHCGSGAVVNEAALMESLSAGHLGGAALDTYTWEPLRPDDPLLELARDPTKNLILTPHIGSGTIAAHRNEREDNYNNLIAMLAGKELQYRLV